MNGTAMHAPSSPAAAAAAAIPPPAPPSSSAFRAPVSLLHPHFPSPLSLGFLSLPPSSSRPPTDHQLALGGPEPVAPAHAAVPEIGRVRLSDISPYEGAPCGVYSKAVEALSGSLTRHNAVVIELGTEDATITRCALESVRMYFKAKAQCGFGSVNGTAWGRHCRSVYTYRAGRPLEDGDLSPPCMSDAFKCFGKAARAALCGIARHLRLRSDVFNHLLDDSPLPPNEISSSMLMAAHSYSTSENGKGVSGGGKKEVEKGLLTLIASDSPGIQVCDPNGRWYLADDRLGPGDLLLITGKSLSHVTAGLRPAASYRVMVECHSGKLSGGRASLTFRLMPQSNAILDCTPITEAGHVIPQSFVPISVSQFMDDMSSEEGAVCNHHDHSFESHSQLNKEPSLRSVLSDPLTGTYLEDAMVVSCGHSFGGYMLKKVLEMGRCNLCDSEVEMGAVIPNYALRAAATAVKNQDEKKLFHNAALRKRRKEIGEQADVSKRPNRENGDSGCPRQSKGVQYPFAVNERVTIKGNRRTPDKFVGRDAVITSQCLNGWYLLKILDSGESVRLQYRSLKKIQSCQGNDGFQAQTSIQNSN